MTFCVVRLYPGAQQLLILRDGLEFMSQMFQDGAAFLEAAQEKRNEFEALGHMMSDAPDTATLSVLGNHPTEED